AMAPPAAVEPPNTESSSANTTSNIISTRPPRLAAWRSSSLCNSVFSTLQRMATLLEGGAGQLQEGFVEVELTRLHAGDLSGRDAGAQFVALVLAIQVEDAPRAGSEDDVDLALVVLPLQVERRIEGDNPPAAKYGHAIADRFHFAHVVRGQDDGD